MVRRSANKRVTIVTVTFNSEDVVEDMLASVPDGVSVVIVDNASRDSDSLKEIAARHNAKLVLNATNEGFGRACNEGARLAQTEFVFFLNPDAILHPDTIEALVTAMDRYPDAICLNPKISRKNGKPFFKRKSYLLARYEWMDRTWPRADRDVSTLSGAAMFMRKTDFDMVGGFDEKIFLYFEDDDLAFRLRKCGRLMFAHEARMVHAGGASSGSSPEVEALKAWHMAFSRVYTTHKHAVFLGRSRAFLAIIRGFLRPRVLLSPSKRAAQFAALAGARAALRGYESERRL